MFKIIAIITLGLLVEEAKARGGVTSCSCSRGAKAERNDLTPLRRRRNPSCRECMDTGIIETSSGFGGFGGPIVEEYDGVNGVGANNQTAILKSQYTPNRRPTSSR